MDCDCEEEKRSFFKSNWFLGLITAFALSMLAFPYYSGAFYPQTETSIVVIDQKTEIVQVKFTIEGMTCVGCEHHVNTVLRKQEGVIEVESSHEKGMTKVKFDKTLNTVENLAKIVEVETGYTVVKYEIIKKEK